ncbi:GNAT family N-acetyltransferase [Methyloceanibacter sp.]|uniref:GNAT family N-acetyltransferase n=1 Tax=Methyloceanibacter sp. TaxID=1965321 RepID=UPI00351B6CE8
MAAPWPSSLSARIKASCSAWRGLRRTQTFVSAEYAVIVRSDLKGAGLGRKLMQQLIRYVESEGLRDSLFFLLWS